MKALIITPFFPYAEVHHAGGKCVYETIKGLSRRHDIYLFSRIEPHELRFVNEMEAFCKDIKLYTFKTPHKSNPLKTLFVIASYLVLAIKANGIARKGSFDIVQIEHTETGLFIKKVKDALMILDAHDAISKPAERKYLASRRGTQRFISWLKWQIIRKVEVYIARKFDIIFTKSRIDKDILLKLAPNLKINISPHPAEICKNSFNIMREEGIILFVGAMHRDVNQDAVIYFYKNVLPLVRKDMPDIKFYVVGNSPPENIKDLAVKDKNVIVTGYVKSLTPYYHKTTLFVSPILIGGGIIAKNIEAMAHGLPVVTTSIGNEGIEAVPGQDLFIADTPDEFSKKVTLLLKDKDLRTKIGEAGKRFVMEQFNLEQVIEKIDMVWRQPFNYKRMV